MIPKTIEALFLLLGGSILVSTCNFSGSSCTPQLEIISPKEWYTCVPGTIIIFIKLLSFLSWHICITHLNVLPWSLPINIITYNQNTIHSHNATNTLHKSLNISSIFCWKMSPAGTTLNGSLKNLYLSKLACKWGLDIKMFCWVSDCCILNWATIKCNGSAHVLVLRIYHWWLGLFVLFWWVPGWVLWGLSTRRWHHLVLALSQNCNPI